MDMMTVVHFTGRVSSKQWGYTISIAGNIDERFAWSSSKAIQLKPDPFAEGNETAVEHKCGVQISATKEGKEGQRVGKFCMPCKRRSKLVDKGGRNEAVRTR